MTEDEMQKMAIKMTHRAEVILDILQNSGKPAQVLGMLIPCIAQVIYACGRDLNDSMELFDEFISRVKKEIKEAIEERDKNND